MDIKKNQTQLVCIAKFFAKEGEEQDLITMLHGLIKQTQQEGGCLRYELHQSISNRREITFIEKWYDHRTFKEHCEKPYIKEFFNDGDPNHVESHELTLYKELLPALA